MARLQVFVSHSHKDSAYCRAIVKGLQDAGADVWYDEHSMGSGQLGPTIERELRRRPVFVVILSPDALQSQWVEDESRWAYSLLRRDPSRIIQPVTAHGITEDNIWLFLQDFKRIELAGLQPYPADQAVRHLLRALGLTPVGEAPASVAPKPGESVADLVERGKALRAQKRYTEAVPLFERAILLDPGSFDAWFALAYTLFFVPNSSAACLDAYERALAIKPNSTASWAGKAAALRQLDRWNEALAASERALELDSNESLTWSGKGDSLAQLQRYEEALTAYERALALDESLSWGWWGKGKVLHNLKRYEEALAAFDRALALDPNFTYAWNSKGLALDDLKRYEDALVAFDRALALDPNFSNAWNSKGNALYGLQRYEEALAAYDRALALDPANAMAWYNKGNALCGLQRYDEALVAYDQGFDRSDPRDWRAHARVYRALDRITEAEAAERRAKELGG